MQALPSLRRKILRSFSVMILMYAGLGVLLVAGVLVASATTPKLIHLNYDSIAASHQMKEAWAAINHPEEYAFKPMPAWRRQFESALKFEDGNLTEPNEKEVVRGVHLVWDHNQAAIAISRADFVEMNQLLSGLVAINETGMFKVAQDNSELSHLVLVGAIAYFLITLILSFLLADGLSGRLSRPLKGLAEALHRKPSIGRRLKLIEPNTLELLILTQELTQLWSRVEEGEKVNVMQIVSEKAKLETVLASVEDGLLVIDSAGKVSHCNECVLDLVGLPTTAVVAAPWADLPTNHANYLKLRSVLRADLPESSTLELTLRGVERQFSARFRKIQEVDSRPGAALYLLHDITEKRLREKFRSEFIDLLSHELKTPLQSLGTASELLTAQQMELPDTLRPLVETISEDVERIRAVANEFVQVTQSHSKIIKLRMDLVPLNQALPDWMRPFKIVAKDRGVSLTFEQEGSEVIWARLDTVKFPWVISNLLSNAIRFSPVGAKVEVCLTDRNGHVEIQVKDDGPGVSEVDQLRMFEPFFQSSMVTTGGKHGLFGIGLTIAKEVVEAHDGRIEYYPRSPGGSEFRIVLPFPTDSYS